MIHIDRKRVAVPDALLRQFPLLYDQAETHFQGPRVDIEQQKFEFANLSPLILEHLDRLFHGKCAYCETIIRGTLNARVDNFRPNQFAAGLVREEVSPSHYWWLAYSWDNLYYACTNCVRSKRDFFPVKGSRATETATGWLLQQEVRMLLDPCEDDPEKEFAYDLSSSPGKIYLVGTTERAESTISILNLNREDLAVSRFHSTRWERERILSCRSQLNELGDLHPDERRRLKSDLEVAAGPTTLFAGLLRFMIRNAFDIQDRFKLGFKLPDLAVEQLFDLEGLPAGYRDFPGTPDQNARTVWPTSVRFLNFGPIEDLHIVLPNPLPTDGFQAPWVMLVGPNGVGKSTILEGIALALCDRDEREMLIKDGARFLSKPKSSSISIDKGAVRVALSTGQVSSVEFKPGRKEVTVIGSERNIRILGYGPHRLPPTIDRPIRKSGASAIANLFDPLSPIGNGEKWLASDRRDDSEFNILVRSVNELLGPNGLQNSGTIVTRSKGRLMVQLFGVETSLSELSSGYRSLISLVLDIAMHLSDEKLNVSSAQGIVLVDEIETHLHPLWKQKIVPILRQLFPFVQFIATTHDPLCLRGLYPGEIFRLNRSPIDGKVYAEIIDIPAGLSIDDLLTGEWFKLDQLYDTDTNNLLLELARLVADGRSFKDPVVRKCEAELQKRLDYFPRTSLERLTYSVALELIREANQSNTDNFLMVPENASEFRKRLAETARKRASENYD